MRTESETWAEPEGEGAAEVAGELSVGELDPPPGDADVHAACARTSTAVITPR